MGNSHIRKQQNESEGGEENDGVSKRTHLVIFIHGFLGRPSDFQNLERMILGVPGAGDEFLPVLVSSNGYVGGTFDGIENGSKRIFSQVLEVIKKNKQLQRVSICGHSLGGIYARYLIYLMDDHGLFDVLQPASFVTFASPHLGIRKQAFFLGNLFNKLVLPIVRTTRELGLLDCYHVGENKSCILYHMATEEKFLSPLVKFRRRILYSNIRNDPQVSYTSSSIRFSNPYYSTKSHSFMGIFYSQDKQTDTLSEQAENTEAEKKKNFSMRKLSVGSRRSTKNLECSAEYQNITQWSIENVALRQHWKTACKIEKNVVMPKNLEGENAEFSSSDSERLLSESFASDNLKERIQEMIYQLDVRVGGWERYDVHFSSLLAHEMLIHKHSLFGGKSVATHLVDTILVPSHYQDLDQSGIGVIDDIAD